MNYRTNLLRNEIKKLQQKEELLINTSPTAKSYKELEQERNNLKNDITNFHQATKNWKKKSEVLEQENKDKDQIIKNLQQEKEDQKGKLAEAQKDYQTKLLQKDKENKDNIKYYVEKWHKKARPGKASIGIQTDLKDNQITLLTNQWNQVAEWASELGININKKWNLNNLKKKLEKQTEEIKQDNQLLQEENIKVKDKNVLLVQEIKKEQESNQPLKERVKFLEENDKTLQDQIKDKEKELSQFQQAKVVWEKDFKEITNKNIKLTEKLEKRKNWGDDKLPHLQEELLKPVKEIIKELKEKVLSAYIVKGRSDVFTALEKMDNYFQERERERRK